MLLYRSDNKQTGLHARVISDATPGKHFAATLFDVAINEFVGERFLFATLEEAAKKCDDLAAGT